MNPNLRRIFIENDLSENLEKVDNHTLALVIKNSNISKVLKISDFRQLAAELTRFYMQSDETNSLSVFFRNLNLMVIPSISTLTANIFIKHTDIDKYKLPDNDICYCK